MAIDSGLRKEITELLIGLPLLQNKEGSAKGNTGN